LSSAFQVTGFDHVVLNVEDVERSLAFYCDELGLKPERVEEWRNKEVFFPSVRIDDHTLIDLLQVPRTGENANHICLVVAPADFGRHQGQRPLRRRRRPRRPLGRPRRRHLALRQRPRRQHRRAPLLLKRLVLCAFVVV